MLHATGLPMEPCETLSMPIWLACRVIKLVTSWQMVIQCERTLTVLFQPALNLSCKWGKYHDQLDLCCTAIDVKENLPAVFIDIIFDREGCRKCSSRRLALAVSLVKSRRGFTRFAITTEMMMIHENIKRSIVQCFVVDWTIFSTISRTESTTVAADNLSSVSWTSNFWTASAEKLDWSMWLMTAWKHSLVSLLKVQISGQQVSSLYCFWHPRSV